METRDDYIKFLRTLYEYINFFYALKLLRRPHITCYHKKPTKNQLTATIFLCVLFHGILKGEKSREEVKRNEEREREREWTQDS